VARGRNLIEFSGNASQVQAAFHAAMHKYVIGGRQYWANANDPAIPAALTPAVAGIASLNNFPRQAAHRVVGNFTRTKAGKLIPKAAANPQFTFAAGCNGTGSNGTLTNCYALTPYDFATIYNVLPLWTASTPITGSGQFIAIVSDSDISAADFNNFRSLFGLPAGTLNQIHTNTDPGVLGGPNCNPNTTSCNESEADVDTQWSGAVAPGANIDLVVSSDTTASFGGDLSAEYVIDGKDTNNPKVIGYSYGLCEFFLGTTGNQFYGGTAVKDVTGEWTQAAAEGITVVVSTGDTGSTGCESPSGNPPSDQPAIFGLAVNGISSTPYNVAVGGTDFNDGPLATAQNYWNATNASTTQASVKGYIPEIPYNDSCINAPLDALYDSGASTDGPTNCNTYFNSTTLGLGPLVVPFGGGGGPSDCISSNYNATNDTGTFSSCSAGYAKPSWQTGSGVPADGVRDLPDIAIFGGDGTFQNFYLYCEQDLDTTSTTACSLTPGSTTAPYPDIQGIGGTSVSAEVFVGMTALLNQALGTSGPVGLPNQNLYALAAQPWANCQSSGTLTSGCIFYQVTSGSTAMPCQNASTKYGTAPDCSQATGANVGITEVNGSPAYTAAAGYNFATGLGSLNVYNLVNEWNVGSGGAPDFIISASSTAVTIPSPGQSGNTTLTVVPVNNFTDTVAFSASSCSGLPTGVTCAFSTSPVSANGTTTLTFNTTTSAGAPPPLQPNNRFVLWPAPGILALGCFLALAILWIGLRTKNPRWGLSLASLVFLVFLGIAGCGGSSSYNNTMSQVATPTFTPVAGTYSSGQAVTISDSTSGATIYYTTDGTTPTTSSTQYSGPITLKHTETIEAIAAASNMTNSAVGTAMYTVNPVPVVVTITGTSTAGKVSHSTTVMLTIQ
jgi:hypothetical protein